MKSVDLRRVFLTVCVLALLVMYSVMWMRLLSDPRIRTGSDYIAFYAAGRVAEMQGYGKIYDLALQERAEEEVLGFKILPDDVAPFVHPPFIVPALAVLTTTDYVSSFQIWATFLLIIYAACSSLLLSYFPELTTNDKIWVFLGAILFFPAFISILNGQDSALVLLGAAAWLLGFSRKDDRLAGLGLALTTLRPHMALMLAIPFLVKRRQVFWWFCAGAGLLLVISVALIGFDGITSYLKILIISASGEGYKINEASMVNMLGALRRIFPLVPAQTARIWGWIIYVAATLGMVVVWIKSHIIEEIHLGLAITVSILAVPHLHYHDTVLLLIPLFIIIRMAWKQRLLAAPSVKLIVLPLSLLMMFSYSVPILKFSIIYVLAALFVLLYWRLHTVPFPVLNSIRMIETATDITKQNAHKEN